jgi:hypothetical protein
MASILRRFGWDGRDAVCTSARECAALVPVPYRYYKEVSTAMIYMYVLTKAATG